MSHGGFDNRNLFEEMMSLRCEVKSLRRTIDEFKSGKRYLKLQADFKRVAAGYIKEIEKLKRELSDAHAQTVNVRNIWYDTCSRVWEEHQSEMAAKNDAIRKLEDEIWKTRLERDENIASVKEMYKESLYEKDSIIEELKNRLAHAEALLGRDSTNTGLPTSQTPPGKKKLVPNSRRGQGKNKGGQPGHEKHVMEKPPRDEVTDEIGHELKDGEYCPTCGSDDMIYTGEYEEKYEVDIEINVKKILHKYYLYQCGKCGEIVRTGIDPNLWAQCQYGSGVQALALSLMNTTNAAINKIPLLLSGLTEGEICPSEGYISKLMARAAKRLKPFMEDLFKVLIEKKTVYWDDTVVMINTKRACLRFYGDETLAYYTAHEGKGMDGIIEDGVLDALTEETNVMHDHNKVNYNNRFSYGNLECNAHVQRDLQKSADETGHSEMLEIKKLISAAIRDRNELAAQGVKGFSDRYIAAFEESLTELLKKAEEKAEDNKSAYSAPFEQALVKRIKEYRKSYFAWVRDFTLPVTNNLSERSLRRAKTKMKVAGQFANVKNAGYYATIQSYIETCRRNGLNEMAALSRLCSGSPYSVEEIFSMG